MEISINIGKFGDDEFLEIEKMEVESLDEILSGKKLVELIREKQQDEDIDVLRTIFDTKRSMLFAWIETVEIAQRRAALERRNRWGNPDQGGWQSVRKNEGEN